MNKRTYDNLNNLYANVKKNKKHKDVKKMNNSTLKNF